MGKNQWDGAGWLNGATEERIIFVPLQGERQRDHGSKAHGGCVCKAGHLNRSTVRLCELCKQQSIPCVTAGRLRSGSCGTWQSRSACLGKQGTPGLGFSEMKSSACKSGLQVAIMDRNCGNRNTQAGAGQARWGKYRCINLQGREKEKHRDMLHSSQLFSNSTAACHHCDK